MELQLVSQTGSGEELCSTPIGIRIRLLNKPITHPEMLSFFDKVKEIYPTTKTLRIFFNNRSVKRRWGLANYSTRELLVYRRCVCVFLHELAHFVAIDKYGKSALQHSSLFAKTLDELIWMWETK